MDPAPGLPVCDITLAGELVPNTCLRSFTVPSEHGVAVSAGAVVKVQGRSARLVTGRPGLTVGLGQRGTGEQKPRQQGK